MTREPKTTTYAEAYRTTSTNHLYSLTHHGYIRLRMVYGRAQVEMASGTSHGYKPTDTFTWIPS